MAEYTNELSVGGNGTWSATVPLVVSYKQIVDLAQTDAGGKALATAKYLVLGPKTFVAVVFGKYSTSDSGDVDGLDNSEHIVKYGTGDDAYECNETTAKAFLVRLDPADLLNAPESIRALEVVAANRPVFRHVL